MTFHMKQVWAQQNDNGAALAQLGTYCIAAATVLLTIAGIAFGYNVFH